MGAEILSNKIHDLVNRSGLHNIINNDAIKWNSYFNLLDNTDNDEYWDRLHDEQCALFLFMKEQIRCFFINGVDETALNNYTYTAIEISLSNNNIK